MEKSKKDSLEDHIQIKTEYEKEIGRVVYTATLNLKTRICCLENEIEDSQFELIELIKKQLKAEILRWITEKTINYFIENSREIQIVGTKYRIHLTPKATENCLLVHPESYAKLLQNPDLFGVLTYGVR